MSARIFALSLALSCAASSCGVRPAPVVVEAPSPVAPVEPEVSPGFCAVAVAKSEIRLFPIVGKTFVLLSDGPTDDYRQEYGNSTVPLEDYFCASTIMMIGAAGGPAKLEHDPNLDRGFDCYNGRPSIEAMGGRWPDRVCSRQEAIRLTIVNRWSDKGWIEGSDLDLGCGRDGPWIHDTHLALGMTAPHPFQYMSHPPHTQLHQFYVTGKGAPKPPALRLGRLTADPNEGADGWAAAFQATSSGTLAVVWLRDQNAVTLEMWSPGAASTTLVDAPPAKGRLIRGQIALRGPADIDVLALQEMSPSGKIPYAIHYDGRTARAISVPQEPVHDAALLPDGTMVLLGTDIVVQARDGTVTRRTIGAASIRNSLFAPIMTDAELWARSADDLWIVATIPNKAGLDAGKRVLLHACPSADVARVPKRSPPPPEPENEAR